MDHSRQDDVFFNNAALHSEASHTNSDEQMARALQRQLDIEDSAASAAQPKSDIDSDARLAKRIYEEERMGGDEDAKMAKRMQDEEIGSAGGRRDEDNDEDAKLAKMLQDEDIKAGADRTHRAGPPTCPTCGESNLNMRSSLTALDRTYCNNGSCFVCDLCQAPIMTPTYQVAVIDGSRVPCHKECYVDAMVPKCVVCEDPVPSGGGGSYVFSKHPFFQDWRYCGGHERGSKRCTS